MREQQNRLITLPGFLYRMFGKRDITRTDSLQFFFLDSLKATFFVELQSHRNRDKLFCQNYYLFFRLTDFPHTSTYELKSIGVILTF